MPNLDDKPSVPFQQYFYDDESFLPSTPLGWLTAILLTLVNLIWISYL